MQNLSWLNLSLLIVGAGWSAVWMSIALWKAARRKDIIWFVIILLIHTMGILDIIYIFFISNKKQEK
jgi:methionyl-tRNA synthetase